MYISITITNSSSSSDVLRDVIAKALDLNPHEPLLVTLDYNRKHFRADDAAPTFSLNQQGNKSKNLKFNLAKELVAMYLDKYWGKKSVVLEGVDPNRKKYVAPTNVIKAPTQPPPVVVPTPPPAEQFKPDMEKVHQLVDMGFDRALAIGALEGAKNSFQRALDDILNGKATPSKNVGGEVDVQELMGMGFSEKRAKEALEKFRGDFRKTLDYLVNVGYDGV